MTLRPLGEKDLETICRWDLEYYIAAVPEPGDDRHLDTRKDYEKILHSRTARMFAIEADDGSLIGDIGLVEISWRKGEAELVVRIGDDRYRGRSYGQDAIACLLEYVFGHTKLGRVYLRVFEENIPAVRCFEKCGFRKEWMMMRKPEGGGHARKVILMALEKEDFFKTARCQAAADVADLFGSAV
ncbi:MAG: GNAT family protein [Bacillota bacterium]|nr:GNAT family protein [Bacillota bacterium]